MRWRHQAVAYLLKPVRERDLEGALGRRRFASIAPQLDALGVSSGGRRDIVSAGHRGVETLSVADVRCFLAEDKYVRACAPGAELLLSESLKELEAEVCEPFPARAPQRAGGDGTRAASPLARTAAGLSS